MAKKQKRNRKLANDIASFTREYQRTSRRRGLDPNDRHYDHELQAKIRRLKPADLDALLRDEDFDDSLLLRCPLKNAIDQPEPETPMLPSFDESGWLPPGVHPATLDEITERFGVQSEIRRVQMESVRWMVDLAAQAGVHRIVLNGSFATDIMEPNDVDCVLLLIPGRQRSRVAIKKLRAGLPFLDIALVNLRDFEKLVGDFFAVDRLGTPKGMIEIIQWN